MEPTPTGGLASARPLLLLVLLWVELNGVGEALHRYLVLSRGSEAVSCSWRKRRRVTFASRQRLRENVDVTHQRGPGCVWHIPH